MSIRLPLLSAAALLLPLGAAGAQAPAAPVQAAPPAAAATAAPSEACARFDQAETEGKAEVERRIAAIDAAASSGNVEGFCAATDDLVFVYRSMRDAAAACSPERATRWADASTRTEAALSGTCQP